MDWWKQAGRSGKLHFAELSSDFDLWKLVARVLGTQVDPHVADLLFWNPR